MSCENKEEIEDSELTLTSTFSSSVDQKEKTAFDVFMTAFNKTFSESGSSTTKTSILTSAKSCKYKAKSL